jgi:hypothetical protein
MPAKLKDMARFESGPRPLDIVRGAEGTELRYDPDGNVERLDLLPPMPESDIERLADRIPCPLPGSVRELLQHTRGFATGPLESLEFGGLDAFEFPEVFPHAVDLAHDGFGNYWVADLTSASREWGPIYFACHDPPVIVFQSPDLSRFLEEVLKLGDPDGPRSELDAVHEDHAMQIWTGNPEMIVLEECLASGDPVLEEFARTLPEGFEVRDLRGAGLGDGFSWGRYGPRTANRRAGEAPVFAYQRRSRGQRLRDWLGGSRGGT